jgi:hypothetical protein
VNLPHLFDGTYYLTARFAKPTALFLTLATLGLVAGSLLLPRRWLHLPLLAAGALAISTLLATLTLGEEAWSFSTALLMMAACWVVGGWTLRALRVPTLASSPPVAWLAGTGVLGLLLLFVGWAGLLRWWTVGIPVLGLGALGLYRIARAAPPAIASAWAVATENRLAVGCAALLILIAGMSAIWTAAPELMFDALEVKAWLPSEWARLGEITAARIHPFQNLAGSGLLLAIPGHLFGAEGVGRYLQWLASGMVPVSLWWFLRPRTPWAPLAAVAVAITPLLFWESTTAYDDAILVLAAVALAQAVVLLLERPQARGWEGVALGVIAGTCVDLKLHLVWLAAGLLLAYLVRRKAGRLRVLCGLAIGFTLLAAPPLVQRWIDVGNPVMPAYNNVFRSPYWLSVNDTGFPYFHGGPAQTLWKSLTQPEALEQTLPVGGFGILGVALAAALFVGVLALSRRRRDVTLIVLWGGLSVATVAWFIQFRYLRYALPLGVIAVMVLALTARGYRLTPRVERVGLLAVAAVSVLLWPATLAQFWNLPGKDIPLAAALGLTNDRTYERQAMFEREALAAFDAQAPPGSMAVSTAYQRAWLSGGRDLEPEWELQGRMAIDEAAFPTTPREALRRIRELGPTWALLPDAELRQPSLYYLYSVIAHYGELRWAEQGWSLYKLTAHPRAPAPLPKCDDRLAGQQGCWTGTLDNRPGYQAEESPVGISRNVAVCAGETVTLDVGTIGGSTPLSVWIDFNGPDPGRGHVRPLVAPDTVARVGGTAPPGATVATVSIEPPPSGTTVTYARLGHVGHCQGSGGD